jgi:hypothetical protein
MNLDKIVFVKGIKKGMVYLRPITLKSVLDCFKYKNKRRYLGIDWNLFKEGSEGYILIEEFLDFVAARARKWWTPYWFLNLLHLYGNDNSIIRCRSNKVSGWCRRLTNGIMITDIKDKWGTLRIYGSFTKEIYDRLRDLENKIDPILEP